MQNLSVDSSDSTKLNQSNKRGRRSSFGGNQPSHFSVQEPKAENESPLPCSFEKEPGIKLAREGGFYGPDKSHILTFDQAKVRT